MQPVKQGTTEAELMPLATSSLHLALLNFHVYLVRVAGRLR